MEHPGREQSGKDRQSREDLYGVLGVGSDAPRQEIVRAYHRAAHQAHPDAQPHDPQGGIRFRALTEAYDVLSNPARRAHYDRTHPEPEPEPEPEQRPASTRRRTPPLGSGPLWAGPVHIEPPAGVISARGHNQTVP